MRNSIVILACLLWASLAFATIDQPMANAAQEQTARGIFRELRCVVCEGQSIAESNATLATQMREQVRAMVVEGKTTHEILTTFRDAYGEKILLTPPLEPATALLWLAPLLMLALGAILLTRVTRPKQGMDP